MRGACVGPSPRCNVLLPPNPGSTEPCSTAVHSCWGGLVEPWLSLVECQPLVEILVELVEFSPWLTFNLSQPNSSTAPNIPMQHERPQPLPKADELVQRHHATPSHHQAGACSSAAQPHLLQRFMPSDHVCAW